MTKINGYEPVIGIETHVELTTQSKMFCGCAVDFQSPPNTNICPVCLGLPGALPVVNETAVDYAMALGAALNCRIVDRSIFHRKNYFYPDMPKNYQISQYDLPLSVDGHLDIDSDGKRVGITRVHMEEDTGKSTHVGEGGRIHAAVRTLLDFNRAGVPLMEVVSEPDLRSPEDARSYANELRSIVLGLGVSDAKLEEGSMRFDANVSVRPVGSAGMGTKVEVKNMNSLRSLERAIAFEVSRQAALVKSGGEVLQETRHWNEEAGTTESMRSKEEAFDYRYFPEPDLVPLVVDDAWRSRITGNLPELPAQRRARYRELGLDQRDAALLARDPAFGELFQAAVSTGAAPQPVANWITGEITAYLRRTGKALSDTPLGGQALVDLDAMVRGKDLSATAAKEVLVGILDGEGTAAEVAANRDLIQVSDDDALEPVIGRVVAENADAMAKLAGGDEKVLGFLIGQVMKETGGKADPGRVSEMIRARVAG